MRVAAEIEERLDVEFPLEELLVNPTVAGVAAALQGREPVDPQTAPV
jgi:hypothetical protein